jgi:hypothetical protein
MTPKTRALQAVAGRQERGARTCTEQNDKAGPYCREVATNEPRQNALMMMDRAVTSIDLLAFQNLISHEGKHVKDLCAVGTPLS